MRKTTKVMKEIKDLNKQIFHVYKQEDSIWLSVLLNLIYRFNAISIKIQANYSVDIDKLIQKFTWKGKRPFCLLLKEKNKVGKLTLPDFKTYYNATVIKTLWYWQRIDKQTQ